MSKILLEYVNTSILVLLAVVLGLAFRRKMFRNVPSFLGLIGVSLIHQALGLALMFHRRATGLTVAQAYRLFFVVVWAGQLIEGILVVFCIYNIYSTLMRPLPGLHRLGSLVFRWVAGISIVLGIMMALAPHARGYDYFTTTVGQVQEGVSILTICLLLFLCFATRPLGLTYGSRVFGITLGLAVGATAGLVQAAWMGTATVRSIYAPVNLIYGFSSLLALSIWVTYFVRPEPARKILTLPTTSPWFFWNRISEALGDAPGEVAVAGVSPEMFAPAELLAFTAPARTPAAVVEMPQAAQR